MRKGGRRGKDTQRETSGGGGGMELSKPEYSITTEPTAIGRVIV